MRRWVPWLALAAVVIVALVIVVDRSRPSDSADARARRLERELACPVCTGESVAESNAPESRAMRDDIRDRIDEGQTDDEIRQAYVDVYGERIVLRPEGGGLGVIAWGLPVVVLIVGIAVIVFAVRSWTREPRLAATPDDERIVGEARSKRSDGATAPGATAPPFEGEHPDA